MAAKRLSSPFQQFRRGAFAKPFNKEKMPFHWILQNHQKGAFKANNDYETYGYAPYLP
jgi:hypothetical protein